MAKISYDFDGTLTRADMLEKCIIDIKDGNDVWITTSRWQNPNNGNNNDLYTIAEDLGVAIDKIVFTHHKWKHMFLDSFDIHYDDNDREIDAINEHCTGCKGVLI